MSDTDQRPVASAVSGVLSAVNDCEELFHRIRKKRSESNWPGPSAVLAATLRNIDDQVRGQQRKGIDRFGDMFNVGDVVTADTLNMIEQDVRVYLLKELFQALEDDSISVGTAACSACDDIRMRILIALAELYTRLDTVDFSIRRQSTLLRRGSIRSARAAEAPEVVPIQLSRPPSRSQSRSPPSDTTSIRSVARAFTLRSSPPKPTPPKPATPKETPEEKYPNKFQDVERVSYLPQKMWFKKKSVAANVRRSSVPTVTRSPLTPMTPMTSTSDGTTLWSSAPAESVISPDSSRNLSISSPFSPMGTNTSYFSPILVSAIPEDQSVETQPAILPGAALIDAIGYDSGIGLSSVESSNGSSTSRGSVSSGVMSMSLAAQRTLLRVPKPENNYLGFCKGAVAMQRGEERAFKQQQEMTFGKVNYMMCRDCAFTGRLSTTKVWNQDGLRFRWAFLAKSHVHQTKVKDNVHAYLCMFCVYQGGESIVTQGTDAFLKHVASHRGEMFTDALLERVRCINGRTAIDSEDFDINLLPPSATMPIRPRRATLSSLTDAYQPMSAFPKENEGPFELPAPEPEWMKYSWADTPS